MHISSAEGYTNMTFCMVLIQSIVIFKQKKGGYILKMITKLYVTRNDDTTSFCYKSLITILVVMMMRRRRWTVSIGECPSISPFLKNNGAEAHCF